MNTDPPQKDTYALLPGGPRSRYRGRHQESPAICSTWSNHRNGVDGMPSKIAGGAATGGQCIAPHSGGFDIYMETQLRCRMVRQMEECLTLIADGLGRLTARWLVGEAKEGN
jgi:hypothetical protein